MEDEKDAWPPAPRASAPVGTRPETSESHLTAILLMWGLTVGAYLLQMAQVNILARLCGLVSFGLAVYLLMRRQRAAQIHGMVRLLIAILGFLLVLRR